MLKFQSTVGLAYCGIVLFVATGRYSEAREIPTESPVGRFEFLFDDTWLDRKVGVERVSGVLLRYNEPVLKAERPWETLGIGFFSLIFDAEESKYKVWYRSYCPPLPEPARAGEATSQPLPKGDNREAYLCYAESHDGVAWSRPSLGRVEFRGSRDNNILKATTTADTVYYNITKDIADPDPSRRYKALGYDRAAHSILRDHPHGGVGICVAFSADGLCWNSPPILVMDASDVTDAACILPAKDADTGEWTGFFRPRTSPKRRFIGFSTSRDFIQWSYPRMLLTPDAADDECTEFYGMAIRNIGGWRIGALWVLHNNPDFSPMSNELVYSRYGREYQRAAPRESFVGFGSKGSFDSTMVMPYSILEEEGEIRVYYRGVSVEHGSSRPAKKPSAAQVDLRSATPGSILSGVGLARLPWGHFRGLLAKGEGIVETKWVNNYGKSGVTAIAAVGPNGQIEAELLNVYGEVIPGWSRAESRWSHGARGSLVFHWGTPDRIGYPGQVSPQKGTVSRVLKVRFFLKNATLYGFKVGESGFTPDFSHPIYEIHEQSAPTSSR